MQKVQTMIGVDLGGTKIRLGLVDASGLILHSIEMPTEAKKGPTDIIDRLVATIIPLQRQHTISALGVAVAGQIDSDKATVKFAPNLNWHHLALGQTLQKTLNLPTVVVNDVRAATYGEFQCTERQAIQNLICIFIGTGIGGGMIVNGQLLNGSNNSAGEIGHMIIDFNGPRCTCGNQGCWEAIAGGWAITKKFQEEAAKNPAFVESILKTYGISADQVTPSMLFKIAQDGNPFAQTFLAPVEKALIAGTINLIHMFNPEYLIFGGGIVEGYPELVSIIEKGVRAKALASATEKLKIVPAKYMKDAAVIGSAMMSSFQ